MSYVCITCGSHSEKLYHEYKGGIIKITLCNKCGNVVDKYVEYDIIIVSLDALLLKRQAFRHILINSKIQSYWKFCLVLLICEAIIKLLTQPDKYDQKQWRSDNVIYSALEIDLYWNFLTAAVELLCFLTVVMVFIWFLKCVGKHKDTFPSLRDCSCQLMLSSLGKVLVLPAILWSSKYSVLYTWLCNIFAVAANIQALRVLCPKTNALIVTICIVLAHVLANCAVDIMANIKSTIT